MIKIINSDCVVGMKTLKSNSVDVVMTSPPYNIGTIYSKYKDDKSKAAYLLWSSKWMNEVYRILKPKGSLFLNMGSKPSEPMIPFDVLNRAISSNFKLQNNIHWIKSIYIDRTHGHYKPINSPRYINDCHEYVFHLTKDGAVALDRLAVGVPYSDTTNVNRWISKKTEHCRGNTWYIPYKTIQKRKDERPHPATFPVELAVKCISLHGVNKDMVVVDPFNGLGTTGKACEQLGVNYTGFEIDEEYVKWSRESLGV